MEEEADSHSLYQKPSTPNLKSKLPRLRCSIWTFLLGKVTFVISKSKSINICYLLIKENLRPYNMVAAVE